MQTAEYRFVRFRKQWDHCSHVLICMVKTIVHSLRFTLPPMVDKNVKWTNRKKFYFVKKINILLQTSKA